MKRAHWLLFFATLMLAGMVFTTVVSAETGDSDGLIAPASAASGFAGGDGTEDSPYLIETAEQLRYLAKLHKDGFSSLGVHFRLTKDIDLGARWVTEGSLYGKLLEGESWEPIGSEENVFAGVFDGGGHSIEGLYINTKEDFQGLFGAIGLGARVQNVRIYSAYIHGGSCVGGIAGISTLGNIIDVTMSGHISAEKYSIFVGGICGYNGGNIVNCKNYGVVETRNSLFIGGITGVNTVSVIQCYNTALVSGDICVGGIAGMHTGFIEDCYNIGDIYGEYGAGGLAGGLALGKITCSYNYGTVHGEVVGGLVGINALADEFFDEEFLEEFLEEDTVGEQAIISCYYRASCVEEHNGYGTPLTDEEMKNPASYEGWDFKNVWTILPGSGRNPSLVRLMMYTTKATSARWNGKTQPFAGGSGTKDDPYHIQTAAQLAYLAERVNKGEDFIGTHFRLESDIVLNNVRIPVWTLSARQWTPIGTADRPFAGSFDGGGHTIYGLFVDNPTGLGGLFGFVGPGAEVKNVIGDGYVRGLLYTGAVAGINAGTISNVVNRATVRGSTAAGGVVGSNLGVVEYARNTGQVEGHLGVGGIAGTSTEIYNCVNEGDVSGITIVGGLVGGNQQVVSQSYNTGEVKAELAAGGVAGRKRNEAALIEDCFNAGNVTGYFGMGGIAGQDNDGEIVRCYSVGTISANGLFGGIVGLSDGTLLSGVYYLDGTLQKDPWEHSAEPNNFGEKLTEAQMGDPAAYNQWDFYIVWYTDGEYPYPQLRALPMYGEDAWDNPFADVPEGAWFYDAVRFAQENKLFMGVSGTEFAPSVNMNRAMFVTVLGRLYGVDTARYTGTWSVFNDVEPGSWYAPYVEWAALFNIVTGDGQGNFRPYDPITREEMCVILARFANFLGLQLNITAGEIGFTDSAGVSPWASDAVSVFEQAGIVTGMADGSFRPKKAASRAEVAVILQRFVNLLD